MVVVGDGEGVVVVGDGEGVVVVGVGEGDGVVVVGVGFGVLEGVGVAVGTGVGGGGNARTGWPSRAPPVYAVQMRVGYSAPVKTDIPPTPFSGAW